MMPSTNPHQNENKIFHKESFEFLAQFWKVGILMASLFHRSFISYLTTQVLIIFCIAQKLGYVTERASSLLGLNLNV